jgi:hypothetical protein
MHPITWLARHETIINQLWVLTLISMVALYVVCNLVPDRIVGKYLPLHNVFKPKTNVDLDYQSIGYAMLHTKWITRITHYTIIFEVMLWFVIFQSWHWSIPFLVLSAILLQSFFIGDRKFGLCFILMGLVTFVTSMYFIRILGIHNAALLSKAILMAGGLMRMIGHSAEHMPPLLLDKSDQFVKLTHKNINYKIPLVAVIGYVAEFGSGLPTRLFPVQVNFLYQTIFRIKPHTTLPWQEIEVSAKNVLAGGYSKLTSLQSYYNGVTQVE